MQVCRLGGGAMETLMADNLVGDVISFYEWHARAWVGARLMEANDYGSTVFVACFRRMDQFLI
jgi:hypothetical protein